MMNLFELAAIMGATALELRRNQRRDTMEDICKVIKDEAQRVIGTYDYEWPPLAEATKADRVRLGFAADEPLLRTGELRDSIEYDVDEDGEHASVGSNNPVAVFQEFGTITIPPRPFLGGALEHKRKEIEELAGGMLEATMRKVGPTS